METIGTYDDGEEEDPQPALKPKAPESQRPKKSLKTLKPYDGKFKDGAERARLFSRVFSFIPRALKLRTSLLGFRVYL